MSCRYICPGTHCKVSACVRMIAHHWFTNTTGKHIYTSTDVSHKHVDSRQHRKKKRLIPLLENKQNHTREVQNLKPLALVAAEIGSYKINSHSKQVQTTEKEQV